MIVTAQEVARWITAAEYGSELVYHRGRLCEDADISIHDTADARELYNVSRMVRGAFDEGNVHLFTRRLGENNFEYIAIRKNRRRRGLEDRIRQTVKRLMENTRNALLDSKV